MIYDFSNTYLKIKLCGSLSLLCDPQCNKRTITEKHREVAEEHRGETKEDSRYNL